MSRTPRPLIMCLVAALAAACGAAEGPGDPPVDDGPVVLHAGIISASTATVSEHEPSIAVSADGRVAVVWIAAQTARYSLGYRISVNDGVNFAPMELSLPPADGNMCANTSLAADHDGNLYLGWACQKRTATGRSNQHVFVAVSPPGSTTFGEPLEVTDPSDVVGIYDQPRVGISNTGAMVVTYTQASADMSEVSIVGAYYDGAAWTRTPIAGPGPSGSFRNFSRVCASDSSPRVWVAMYSTDVGIELRRSDDGGRTWPAEHRLAVQESGDEDQLSPPFVACAVDGDDVWVLYALSADSSTSKIPKLTSLRLARSSDGGHSIATRSSFSDPGGGAYLLLPSLARDEAGGLNLTYFAGSSEGDPAATYRRRRSTDGDATFGVSEVVHQPLVLETARATRQWLGDYTGLTSANGKLYMAYTDNSAGASHIRFSRVRLGSH